MSSNKLGKSLVQQLKNYIKKSYESLITVSSTAMTTSE